jgi:hypothetical protein
MEWLVATKIIFDCLSRLPEGRKQNCVVDGLNVRIAVERGLKQLRSICLSLSFTRGVEKTFGKNREKEGAVLCQRKDF